MKISILINIRSYLNRGNERSVSAKKNIVGSFINKGFSIFLSLLIVPLTINYVNTTQYGIWLTLSSIIGWINYFDMGFSHGFRNRFAEAKAKGDIVLAQKYVSTTYAVLAILFSLIFIIISIINCFISWGSVLNIDTNMDSEMTKVFFALIFFFCLRIIINTFTTLLLADQRPALSSSINTAGQFLALICIYILTKMTEGSLVYLAISFSGLPCFVILATSFFMYKTQYKQYAPSFKSIDFKLAPNIIGLGIKFFVIQIAMLFIFQFTNIIISRLLGPDAVTEYNVCYKYFSILYMSFTIILTPFWSAFTDAYTQHDYNWMRKVYSKLSKIWLFSILCFIVMLVLSPWVYKIWLNNTVPFSFSLSFAMGLYILMLSRANLYMFLINGTGKVAVQMVIYSFFAIVSIPCMIICCKAWGLIGILSVSFCVYFLQDVLGYIQLQKIMKNRANGIWNK